MNKKAVLTKDLFECDIPFLKEVFEKSTYPWEILPQIKGIVKELLEKGIPGYHLLKEGVLTLQGRMNRKKWRTSCWGTV